MLPHLSDSATEKLRFSFYHTRRHFFYLTTKIYLNSIQTSREGFYPSQVSKNRTYDA